MDPRVGGGFQPQKAFNRFLYGFRPNYLSTWWNLFIGIFVSCYPQCHLDAVKNRFVFKKRMTQVRATTLFGRDAESTQDLILIEDYRSWTGGPVGGGAIRTEDQAIHQETEGSMDLLAATKSRVWAKTQCKPRPIMIATGRLRSSRFHKEVEV